MDNTKECQFAKYGFEVPDFECEIKFKDESGDLIGMVEYHKTMFGIGTNKQTCYWNKKGECIVIYKDKYALCKHRNLTPIKKPWYEDESNFPCYVTREDGTLFPVPITEHICSRENNINWLVCKLFGEDIYSLNAKHYRLATKEEVLNLYKEEV